MGLYSFLPDGDRHTKLQLHELLQYIAHLAPASASALCNKYIRSIFGLRYGSKLRFEPLELEAYFWRFEKDNPYYRLV